MPYPRKVPRQPPEGYISTDEAMRLLDMSLRTFYKYKREYPDFPPQLKEGGKAWYSRKAVQAWKQKHMEI